MFGEDYDGQHSDGHKYKILKPDHYENNQKQDIRAKVYGDNLSNIDISFDREGTHLLAFNSTRKFIELETARCDDCYWIEGLSHVIKPRQQSNDTLKPGRELYRCCVKTLVQVRSPINISHNS